MYYSRKENRTRLVNGLISKLASTYLQMIISYINNFYIEPSWVCYSSLLLYCCPLRTYYDSCFYYYFIINLNLLFHYLEHYLLPLCNPDCVYFYQGFKKKPMCYKVFSINCQFYESVGFFCFLPASLPPPLRIF